jgi:alkylhydroperoxidase/carboxymuconolactone decarboxylase family protein YurZ
MLARRIGLGSAHDHPRTHTTERIVMPAVAEDTQQKLAGISAGDMKFIESAVGLREAALDATGLDARSFALCKIAALIALDAPPASYAWQVANALEDGVTPEDIVGTLLAVAPQVGGPRTIAAAAEITLALGLTLAAAAEFEE